MQNVRYTNTTKMTFATEEKIKCAEIFEQMESAVIMRKIFNNMFKKKTPLASSITTWHKKFWTKGSLTTPVKGNQAWTIRN